jgi:hypothetical protein
MQMQACLIEGHSGLVSASLSGVQSEWLPFQQSLHNVAQQLLEIVGIPEHLGRPDG